MSFLKKLKALFAGPDFKEKIQNGAIIVDVRTEQEFKAGKILGSKNYPLQEFHLHLDKMAGKEVILVCRSGARAAKAKNVLASCGVTAYNAGPWQRLNNL